MRLEEYELREWVRRVAHGEASRRDFIRTMLGLGLSGPLIAEMLATHPSAIAQGRRAAQPDLHPNPARGWREAATAVLAGADDPQRPLRRRHDGTSRLRASSTNR